MRRKLMGDLIQEILERMMVLGMSTTDGAYDTGRIQGLRDAIDLIQRFRISENVINDEGAWFEKCEGCDNELFTVRVTPMGECATDTDWLCIVCGDVVGGVISDPLNELPSIPFQSSTPKAIK